MNLDYTGSTLSCSQLYVAFKNGVFLAFPILIILGNLELWLGSSSLTLPWALIVILPIALVEILNLRRGYCVADLPPFLFLYCLLFALGVLATLFSSVSSLKRVLVSLLPLFIAGITLFSFKSVRLPSNVPKLMRIAGAFLALMVMIKSVWLFLPAWRTDGFGGVIEQKANIGLALGKSNFLAVFLMFFSVFAWREHKKLWLFILLATCMTLSRFGVAFVLLSAVCVWLLDYFRLSVVLLLLAFAGGLLTLPVWLFPNQVAGIFYDFLPASLIARFELWALAMELLRFEPLWGGGPGGFTTYLELIAWPRYDWGPHNFILSRWIEFGILGLLVYWLIIFRFLLLRSSLPGSDRTLLQLGGILFLLYGLVENVVGLVAFEIMFAYLICLLSARRCSS